MRTLFTCFYLSMTMGFSQSYYFPPIDSEEWETITPSDLGWCTEGFEPLRDYLQEKNTKAFLILKDGKMVFEEYYEGFHSDSLWYWASAGKCITASLVGIAEQEGDLTLSDKSTDYLGAGWTDLSLEEEEMITIYHQLTMTTGLNDSDDLDCTDPECLTYLADPGTRWSYHNAPYTLLDEVLNSATGLSLNLYANLKLEAITGMDGLFIPLGYNNVYFSVPRDMARFGILINNNGTWEDSEVINSGYVDEMTNTSQELNKSYGYLWWLNGKESFMIPQTEVVFDGPIAPNAPDDMISALGKNGQILNIVPSQNLIVVRMGEEPGGIESLVPTILNDKIWEYLNEIICETASINDNDSFDLDVYPNPTNGKIQVNHNSPNTLNYELFDQYGRLLMHGVLNESNTIDLTLYAKGSYYIRYTDGQSIHTSSIVLN
ncbi:serine hydrolase [Crocinitomix algicola]|uniref:serine hydrolase n=1 Tax=Crocinitomix algicola TaxID=1740263 RepID=UPI000872DD48|nr:serine hydrolase [Crocinitomix algicola]